MPTKARYLAFEEDPSLEFDHFLCLKLGWGSVERMRREMSNAEWESWNTYYQRRAQERELAAGKAG